MPLGLMRLNERSQRPNANINFIKVLPKSSPQNQSIAQDFLERIAAQCWPIMNNDLISVMSLEEYEPNSEFLGRNFNAGEVIQLVLKDKSGRWLSFEFVQMVMMHELAHCKQMNHSRAFWKVRNHNADQMKELWKQRYTGEGIWGKGRALKNGAFVHGRVPNDADIPQHLCGGTYKRAVGRKRKRGNDDTDASHKPTYAERQQKRIQRKFGTHGEGHGLGEDELVRGALEQGKRRPGKPKVAQSQRGRDLRANAALARFGAEKDKQKEKQMEEEQRALGEGWSEDDDDDDEFTGQPLSGVKDEQGNDMYRVCGDEGEEEEGGQDEIEELRGMQGDPNGHVHGKNGSTEGVHSDASTVDEDDETEDEENQCLELENGLTETSPSSVDKPAFRAIKNMQRSGNVPVPAVKDSSQPPAQPATLPQANGTPPVVAESELRKPEVSAARPGRPAPPLPEPSATSLLSSACPICSLENDATSATCMACSHVLRPSLMRDSWRCRGDQCRGGKYVNAGDAGRCGVCGAQKPPASESRQPMGVTGADVLRWD